MLNYLCMYYSNLTITHLEYFYAGLLLCAQVVTSHVMSKILHAKRQKLLK